MIHLNKKKKAVIASLPVGRQGSAKQSPPSRVEIASLRRAFARNDGVRVIVIAGLWFCKGRINYCFFTIYNCVTTGCLSFIIYNL